jgi:hypothetical protein
MRLPIIQGIIDRRILVNYRVEPEVLQKHLPPPFRPKLINGYGIAGICLIRLKEIRPRGLPAVTGISSENAAHRFAVEWQENGRWHEGVYIPRRDSSSHFNVATGGRFFPGVHHHAHFQVTEHDDYLQVILDSNDGSVHLTVSGRVAPNLPATSIFPSLAAASDFFERGALGYSPARQPGQFDGLELRSLRWQMEPLSVEFVESNFFGDEQLFPAGSTNFDCALLMRGIHHEWHGRESLCSPTGEPFASPT